MTADLPARAKGRIGVEGFVSDQSAGRHVRQRRIGAGQIARLSCGQQKRQRIAECVDQGVDFSIVLSIIAYSLSASAARCSKIFCQTPVLLQRLNRRWVFFQSPNRSGRSRQGIPAR
jgi:hypothetical protein